MQRMALLPIPGIYDNDLSYNEVLSLLVYKKRRGFINLAVYHFDLKFQKHPILLARISPLTN